MEGPAAVKAFGLAVSEIKLRDFHGSSIQPQYRVSLSSGLWIDRTLNIYIFIFLSTDKNSLGVFLLFCSSSSTTTTTVTTV